MTSVTKYLLNLEQIREIARKDNGKFLSTLDKETDWWAVEQIIKTQINELSSGLIFDIGVLTVFKIVLLGEIYKLEGQELLQNVIDRSSFRSFVGIKSDLELPDAITLKRFKILLRTYGVYDDLLDAVLDKVIPEESTQGTGTDFIPLSQNELIDKKIYEIEERIKKLHEKNLYHVTESTFETETTSGLKDKLAEAENQVKNITRIVEESEKSSHLTEAEPIKNEVLLKKLDEQIYQKLQAIEERLKHLDHKVALESFREEGISEPKEVENQLKDIEKNLNSLETFSATALKEEDSLTKERIPEPERKVVEAPLKEKSSEVSGKKAIAEPFIITPKQKTAGIFNDANLTEDYELGYRFFELGFKTGFFNIKVDKNDEASRIATAEFFPNTFWAAVKQRSRWIAGICFQNWSAHKWKGNIVTKYFLFRDRKSLFTFIGAFLSNIVFLYFLYAVIARLFRFENAYSLVGHSSVLWYLMVANLVFMISRAAHRFIFTYNWYGFKYAFFSFFRLILDTFINFVAIIRSISVYRKTKKQVVWDSTSHY